MQSQWKTNVAVGLFVVIVFSVFMYFIMNYTNELGLFEPKVFIKTKLKRPEGLFVGGAVMLNNVKIGRITEIKFADDIADNTVFITMVINREDLLRIGKDAIAKIATVGLLGDNIINIEAGNPQKEGHIEAGDYVDSEEYSGMFGDMGPLMEKIESILETIDKEGIEGISSTIKNLSEITGKINNGEGTAGQLITNDELFNELNATISELNKVMARVNRGPGSIHTLLYKDDVGAVMADLKNISKNLAEVSEQVAGILQDVEDAEVAKKIGELGENLASASESLANIAKSIENGEGTVGALLKDPSLYEDLKVIMQGAERSEALKFVIQHTIRQKQKAAEKERKRKKDTEEAEEPVTDIEAEEDTTSNEIEFPPPSFEANSGSEIDIISEALALPETEAAGLEDTIKQ